MSACRTFRSVWYLLVLWWLLRCKRAELTWSARLLADIVPVAGWDRSYYSVLRHARCSLGHKSVLPPGPSVSDWCGDFVENSQGICQDGLVRLDPAFDWLITWELCISGQVELVAMPIHPLVLPGARRKLRRTDTGLRGVLFLNEVTGLLALVKHLLASFS